VASGKGDGFETVNAEVVEANSRHDGSPNYQAELLFTMGQALGTSGRPRTMCIRGPYRPDRNAAEEDADKLLKVAENEGMAKVRELAVSLKRSRVR